MNFEELNDEAAHQGAPPVQIALGRGLAALFAPTSGPTLVERVTALRHAIARELGGVFDAVTFRLQDDLEPLAYQILMGERCYGSGTLHLDRLAAIPLTEVDLQACLTGIPFCEPYYDRRAVWVMPDDVAAQTHPDALRVAPVEVLLTHLDGFFHLYLHEQLSPTSVQFALEALRKRDPVLVQAFDASPLSLLDLTGVLRTVLASGLPIRNLSGILEHLLLRAHETPARPALAESLRATVLQKEVERRLWQTDSKVGAIALSPLATAQLRRAARTGPALSTATSRALIDQVWAAFHKHDVFTLVCDADLRPHVEALITQHKGRWKPESGPSVITEGELSAALTLDRRATVSWPRTSKKYTVRKAGIPPRHQATVAGLQAAAEAGDTQAAYELGLFYIERADVAVDGTSGLAWLRLAAVQGHSFAQLMLGALLTQGTVYPRDTQAGLRWLERAAARGDADAYYLLGQLSWQGNGVPQDVEEAFRWFELAAQKGNLNARSQLAQRLLQNDPATADAEHIDPLEQP